MARNQILQEVLDKIKARYGDLNYDCGAYVSTDRGYRWLSVAKIVEIIESVDEDN